MAALFQSSVRPRGTRDEISRPTAHPPCRFRLPLVGKSVRFQASELPQLRETELVVQWTAQSKSQQKPQCDVFVSVSLAPSALSHGHKADPPKSACHVMWGPRQE